MRGIVCFLILGLTVLAQPSRVEPVDPPTPKLSAAPSEEEVKSAVAQAAARLVAMQEAYDPSGDPFTRRGARVSAEEDREAQIAAWGTDGPEWPYQGVYRVGSGAGAVIPPGYRVGGTAIACSALLATPGFEDDEARRAAFDKGIGFLLEYLRSEPLMDSGFKGGYDVRGWGHIYALQLLVDARQAKLVREKVKPRADVIIRWLIKTLQDTEISVTGGWNYSRRGSRSSPASPFMTAPGIQALMAARAAGFDVDAYVVSRALNTLEDARLPDTGAFQYGTNPSGRTGKGFEAVEGACARMPIAEVTLHLAGRGSVDRIRAALDAFFTHWRWLDQRRAQTGTHIPPFSIAPYYFYYAHQYAGQAIEFLPESEREKYRTLLRQHLWINRSEDGTWNDRIFHRSAAYGSSCAILALTAPHQKQPAGWKL
jgi:hypothetical protein